MRSQRRKRRVFKKTYDAYASTDYALVTTDNLNPHNPTQLEMEFNNATDRVRQKLISAYEKAKMKVPENLFDQTTSVTTLLKDLDELQNSLLDNPLKDYDESLWNSLLNGNTDFLDNPLSLDCDAILAELRDEDEDDDDDDSDDDDDDSSSEDTTEYTITYVVDSTLATFTPTIETYTKSELPLQLETPTPIGDYNFEGWYTEQELTTKLRKNKLTTSYATGNITLYASIQPVDDDGDTDDDSGNSLSVNEDSDASDSESCSVTELAILKVILIVLMIIKIFIRVFVAVYNIIKAMSELIFLAQLAWINPPSVSDLIAYVMQRLSALLFQIIMEIILKLFALLNFDCISANTQEVLNEINAVLSGVQSVAKSFDSAALQLSGASELLAQLQAAIEQALAEAQAQFEELKEQYSWENLKKQFKEAVDGCVEDYRELFTNPKLLYTTAVPAEVREKIQTLINAYKTTRDNIDKTVETVMNTVATFSSSGKIDGTSEKNVTVKTL